MVSCVDANNNDKPTVQVYLRLRPLIPEEEGHELIQYKAKAPHNDTFQVKLPTEPPAKINPAFAAAPPLRHRRRDNTWKVYGGFTGVLEDDCNNQGAYQATVRPLVSQIAEQNQSACVFTYGHTGSGKSHTLLGYNNELGMYKFAAADLLKELQVQDPNKCLLVRVTELYKDQVLDLLTSKPCSIRQDAKGIVQVRGPMMEDEEGRIEQQPLGKLCFTPQEVVECVEVACASRRVGTSTHHSQSSRSHLIVELEVVTSELVDQRNLLLTQNSQLTRLKWLQTERSFGKKHHDRPLPKWALDYNNSQKRRKEIRAYEAIVKETKQGVAKISRNLGGTLVFCDLAGNEYARDAAESTKEELEEAAEINKSLLAVKEMIRALSLKQQSTGKHKHVPYRDSRLTMILARHLQNKAVMLAHISPSQESLKKTINTLNYSSMVNACKQNTKHGKENKP